MGRYVTRIITHEEYKSIVTTLRNGFYLNRISHKPNDMIATALVVESNLGLRIGDVLNLKLSDIIKDGDRYRLDIIEDKTNKKRTFTVPQSTYDYIYRYCQKNKLSDNELIFDTTERNVNKLLSACTEYLNLKNVSTHSFRKMSAYNIYQLTNFDIVATQEFLQHASPTTTQIYLKLGSNRLEKALNENINLL